MLVLADPVLTMVNSNELIIQFPLLETTVHFTRLQLDVIQAIELTVLGPVLLVVDDAVMHHVQVSDVLLRLLILPLLVFDEVRSFQEGVLQPELGGITEHGNEHDHRDDLKVHVAIQVSQEPNNLLDEEVRVDVLEHELH